MMRGWHVVLATTVGFTLLTVSPARAGLCQKRNGVVVSRDTCRRRETAVDLTPFGAQAMSARRAEPVPITGSFAAPTPVATLANLAAGAYALIAKTRLYASAGIPTLGGCTLDAGGDTDPTTGYFDSTQPSSADQYNVTMTLTHTFAASGTVTLTCWVTGASAPQLEAQDTEIVAIRLAAETHTDVHE
ncbi:MAG: hypothetical protein U0807_05495 [Candidatus Binatia bacterium]